MIGSMGKRFAAGVLPLFLLLAWVALPVAGCSHSLARKNGPECAPASAVTNLIRIPPTRQSTDYTCGVAALQSVLLHLDGKDDYSEGTLAVELKADQASGTGYRAIADFARNKGYGAEMRTEMSLADLRRHIDGGNPVIVLFQAWSDAPVDYSQDVEDGHYAVAIGYDVENVYFMDPSVLGNYACIPNREFLDRWHDEDKGERLDRFGLIITNDALKKPYDPDRVIRIR